MSNLDDKSPLLFDDNDFDNELLPLKEKESGNNKGQHKESRVLIVSDEKDILQSYTFDEFLELTKYLKKKSVLLDESTPSLLSPAISHLFDEDASDDEQPVQQDNNNNNNNNFIIPTIQVEDNLKKENVEEEHGASTSKGRGVGLKPPLSRQVSTSSSGTPMIGRKKFKPLWIDLGGIMDTEIIELGKALGIHPLTIEDILSNESSEKVEEFPEYLFVSTSELQYSIAGDLKEVRFYIILYKDFILVFHNRYLHSFDYVLKSFRYLSNTRVPSSDWILCSYFEAINETFVHYSEQLSKEAQTLDDFTLSEDTNVEYRELYVRIGRASRRTTTLLSNLFIKVDILSSLIRQNLNKESQRYLSNIKDRSVRLQQNIKNLEQILENVQNTYISKVSLLLNEESHSLNISMRGFGILSLVFLPMNFIAGIWGMNVRVPGGISHLPEGESGKEYFFIIVSSMLVLGISFYFFMKKIGWLD
ncbi:hypothetical protein DLAC_11763 [Tieghemostelium lacteum]|uniref:CorA family magnesium ion transporterr n=1 Tax=Tieghemostelium lacteum TaxID=361077 RepID=A0A151Z9E2_TIELA|nr:hypothetical protein DLAC_11763 [Tieghemostelium lacteum]|eukprot:KYQ90568.1 hypothetical protein DLAC_11763 [Tieghemostelium lacteum]